MIKYIDPEKVYISLLSGYNTYFDTEDYAETITGEKAKVLQHTKSKELYYATPISTPANLINNEWFINKWRKLIEYPCDSSLLWPVDFIRKDLGLPQSYLVYEFCPCSQYNSISELSKNKDYLGIENPHIRAITLNFIRAFESIDEKGYLFFGIDDDEIFANTNNNSLLIPINENLSIDKDSEIPFVEEEFFSEVVDPYHYATRSKNDQGKEICVYDSLSENYAFVSMIFRLLIGLYPYEGPMMDEYEYNLDSAENKDWIFKYIQTPVFIFDREDKSNSIEMYNKNRVHRERWSQLTERLREMFSNSLVQANVMRINKFIYSPKEWRLAVEEAFKNFA